MVSLSELRQDYQQRSFDVTDALADPMSQLQQWLSDAITAQLPEPNAMTLASVMPDGQPDARVVLLKYLDARGLTFFTSYTSAKGRQLAVNARVCLVFLWLGLERQVRVHGVVNMISSEESDAYFLQRPLLSRMGAIASDQSQDIPSRDWLSARMQQVLAEHTDDPRRPDAWGGYRVKPHYYEFWQGRSNRLHDRIVYRKSIDMHWQLARLAP